MPGERDEKDDMIFIKYMFWTLDSPFTIQDEVASFCSHIDKSKMNIFRIYIDPISVHTILFVLKDDHYTFFPL